MNASLSLLTGSNNGESARRYGTVGCHDEMVDADGELRPHWHTFLQSLDALGHDELRRRWDEARQLLRENGVVFDERYLL